jgi:acetone carboxylase gamma subunit
MPVTPSGIVVPQGIRLPPKMVFRCACGMKFPEKYRRDWERHVANCEKVDEALDRAMRKRSESGFKRMLDREQFAFLRQRAIEKGEIKE